MRRPGLSAILILINVGIAVLAVAAVARAAMVRLERLADQQGLARAGMAAAGALQAIDRLGGDAQLAARRLLEQDELAGAIRSGDASRSAAILAALCARGSLSGCALVEDGRTIASWGAPLAWESITGEARRGRFLTQDGGQLPTLVAAASPIGLEPGPALAVARRLDSAVEKEIARQIHHDVRILGLGASRSQDAGARAEARSRALDSELPAGTRLDVDQIYLHEEPLRDDSGRIVGLIEVSLPRRETIATLRRLERPLFGIAGAVALLAGLGSALIGRRLVRPLTALSGAAARIGGGDLTTPIPRASGFEVGRLAESMEEMRGRLLQLTAALRQRQAEAETILAGIVEGVFAVDRERRVRYLNPQAAALLGVDASAAAGRFCGDLLNPRGPGGERPCEEHCPIIQARSLGGARSTEHLLLPDGSRRTVVITSSPAEPAGMTSGEFRQFQVIRDETEVEATRRLRDAVLANISHEFRTPLTAQLASVELLRDRLQEQDVGQALTLVESLERGTLRLTQLIDNLLESVRIEAGRGSIRRRPVALDEVVEEAMALTGPLIAQRSQSLHVELPYPLPGVIGDAPRLTQVLVNLLVNANKFAPAGSAIGIGGAVRGREIALWVEDEGPGFRSGYGSASFAPFSRGADSGMDEEPEQGGMGLGLWIAKSIVERHGGRVEVRPAGAPGATEDRQEPARPGSRGTRMCIVLPVEERPPA